MLNRRLLRAKAVQYMYGLQQARHSTYQISIDYIKEKFAPDMLSLIPQDTKKLEIEKNQAIELFEQKIQGTTPAQDEAHLEIKKAANEALVLHARNIEKDNQNMAVTLVRETERIFDSYLHALQIIIKIYDVANEELSKKYKYQLVNCELIEKIRSNTKVRTLAGAKEDLERVLEIVYVIVKEQLIKDLVTNEFFKSPTTDIEKQRELIRHFAKEFLMVNELYNSYMEERDLDWQENKQIVKDMLYKTIKSITEETAPSEITLSLSPNWDEDKRFMTQLFALTIEENEKLDLLISEKLQNWDAERITVLDMVIMKIAIIEMIHFPSIPVKVTINEFLEIAKEYSTPKSKDFINGILDVIAIELTASGVIKKSGRGLIDNK